MVNWTNSDLADYVSRRRRSKQVNDKVSAEGLPTSEPERTGRKALVKRAARKAKSSPRFEIVFTVCAVNPLDWDNWSTKQLQDMVVKAGILHGDNWRVLEGRVISRQADSEAEEGTIIEIRPITLSAERL